MPFSPYFDNLIKFQINSLDEHNRVQSILKMSYDELKLLQSDLNTEADLDPAFAISHWCRLSSRAALVRINQLEHLGQAQPASASLGLIGIIGAAMHGLIWGDEFRQRFISK